jgi:hypothetical protein
MTLERADVVAMLASLGDRGPANVPESIDSLELAWLVHQLEQRYGVALELGDSELVRMNTVSAAVEVIRGGLARGTGARGAS